MRVLKYFPAVQLINEILTIYGYDLIIPTELHNESDLGMTHDEVNQLLRSELAKAKVAVVMKCYLAFAPIIDETAPKWVRNRNNC